MMRTAWWDISSEAFDWFLKLRSLKWNTKRVFEKRWLHFVSATIVFLARRALHSDSLTAGRDINICCHFFCLDNVSRAFPSLMVATTDSHGKPFVIRTLEMTQMFFGFIECVHLRDSPQVKNLGNGRNLERDRMKRRCVKAWTARCSTANCANLVTAQGYLLVRVTTLEAHRWPASSCSHGGL